MFSSSSYSSEVESTVQGARALGWASIAIGLTEILFPRWLSRLIGIEDRPGLMRAMGVRELVSGMTILTEDEPTAQLSAGVWSRVAGDALDLTLLGIAAKKTTNPGGLTFATAMVLGITALDVIYAIRLEPDPREESQGVRALTRAAGFGRQESWGGRLRSLVGQD